MTTAATFQSAAAQAFAAHARVVVIHGGHCGDTGSVLSVQPGAAFNGRDLVRIANDNGRSMAFDAAALALEGQAK